MSPAFFILVGFILGVLTSIACCWALSLLIDEPIIWTERRK